MTFWTTATREQKLAQIDGAIECGMTAKQTAMCLGASTKHKGSTVLAYAAAHGRRFNTGMHDKRVKAGSIGGHHGGMTGGIITSRNAGKPDYEISSAFSIFGRDHDEELLFDEVEA